MAATEAYRELDALTVEVMKHNCFKTLVDEFDASFRAFKWFTPMKKLDWYLFTYGRVANNKFQAPTEAERNRLRI